MPEPTPQSNRLATEELDRRLKLLEEKKPIIPKEKEFVDIPKDGQRMIQELEVGTIKNITDKSLYGLLNDTTPQLGGNLDVNDFNIILKFEPTANLTASGLIVTMTVDTNAEGIGAPLFLAADGHLDTADADASTTSPCVALALETGTGSKKVLVHGILRVDSWDWTKGPGTSSLIYVSITVGTLTQTKPTGTDDVIQPVGWAISDDCIYFTPSLLYITHT